MLALREIPSGGWNTFISVAPKDNAKTSFASVGSLLPRLQLVGKTGRLSQMTKRRLGKFLLLLFSHFPHRIDRKIVC